MPGELPRKKFTHYFSILDRDGDGMLERSDFESIVGAVASARGLQEGSAEYGRLRDAVMDTWSHIEEFADPNGDGRATLDEWIQTLDDTINNEDKYERYVTPFATGVFEMLDTDNDDEVGPDEYRQFFSIFGVSTDASDEAFRRLDTNGDGRLTKSELLERVREFHTADDPNAPGNYLFGSFEGAGT